MMILVEPLAAVGDDQAAAFDFADGELLVVAGSAGGMSGGAGAAQAVVDCFETYPNAESDWAGFLMAQLHAHSHRRTTEALTQCRSPY